MGGTIDIKTFPVGSYQTNCYIISDSSTGNAYIIDPGDDGEYIAGKIQTYSLHPLGIIATHGHFDHIMSAFELMSAYAIPFMIHPDDKFLTERMRESAEHFLGMPVIDPPPPDFLPLKPHMTIRLNANAFSVIHTPGHTPGSICLYCPTQSILLSGDTLFAQGGVGRTDFSYSRSDRMNISIQNLFMLPENTVVYPGHGDTTTIGREKHSHEI